MAVGAAAIPMNASEMVGLKSQTDCYVVTEDKDYDPRGVSEYCAPIPFDDVFGCGHFGLPGTCTGAGFPVCCELESNYRKSWYKSATKCSDLHSNVGTKDHEYKYYPCQQQDLIVAKQTQAATCSPCIQLSGQALSTLLNYILNAGVAGTCGKVCSNLKSKREQEACDVICEVVGFKAFIKALNHTDLDPLYFCEEVHACPMAPDNASATIGAVIAQPSSIAKGDTIELVVEVDVKVPSGLGVFRILINGPVTQPVSSSFTLPDGLPVGTQNLAVKIQIKDDDSGDFPTTWSPGSYYFEFEVCQGECGSKHPHSKVFGRKGANFTLTETAEINI